MPARGEMIAWASMPMEKAAAVAPRLQPNSPEISLKKGPMVARKAMRVIMTKKTTARTTQPYQKRESSRMTFMVLSALFARHARKTHDENRARDEHDAREEKARVVVSARVEEHSRHERA